MRRAFVVLFALSIVPCLLRAAEPAATPIGTLPIGADGKPLNLDFETGDLRDWTATGDAFKVQPIKGDTVAPRRDGMKSNHQGQYWIGGYESGATDKPQGTLTSVPFKVTQPWASFLFAAGSKDETRAEVVTADGTVIFKTSGTETETLKRAVVDLRKHQGAQIFVRLIDQSSIGWGHLNFDDFRFHAEEPKFPAELLVKAGAPKGLALPVDVVKFAGLSPAESVKAMELPPGFSATVFAAEPDVAQPVAMAIDARGRVWIAEANNYPKKAKEGEGKDRILILEDTNGDGKFDKKTVFIEGLNLVSGIEVGFGGVWVGQAPHLLFIPLDETGEKPAGPAKILLDGFAYQDTHETLNSFTWGPDGWLYGCHGVFTHSNVGKPGAPDSERTKINAGVWRYHPIRHVFEVFAHGTSNPWGIDFNDRGQAFVTACVIPHLYHIIQGGRYQRQAGQHFNPYTFDDIKTIADHRHWAGGGSPHAGNNKSDATGGGHAHCGALIYNGGSWPAQYTNTIFMDNIHGNRINNDLLEANGSGYVGKHGADFLKTNDRWSRMIAFKTGPDGSVFAIDWYDKQACHLPKEEVWDRSNGRVYKIAFGDPSKMVAPTASANPITSRSGAFQRDVLSHLPGASTLHLVALQSHENDYYARQARRILQERQDKSAIPLLKTDLKETAAHPTVHLRVLWTLHALDGIDEATTLEELKNADAYVRGWAIQLACESAAPSAPLLAEFARLAKEDPSPVVRLYLASAAQRLAPELRWDIVKGLISHGEDASDHNLPLMYWYALEPLVGLDKAKGLTLAAGGKIPLMREYATRRLASVK